MCQCQYYQYPILFQCLLPAFYKCQYGYNSYHNIVHILRKYNDAKVLSKYLQDNLLRLARASYNASKVYALIFEQKINFKQDASK